MDFIISKAQQQQQQQQLQQHQQPSFSEAEKKEGDHHEVSESEAHSSITRHVYLKSSSSANSAALDRNVVLRRIRHHKQLSKLRSAFQAFMGSSEQATSQAWLHQEDTFSSP